MFDFEYDELGHLHYPQSPTNHLLLSNSSTLQPWNRTSIGYHKKKQSINNNFKKNSFASKTQQAFFNRNESFGERRRKSDLQKKAKFPVTTLNFYPDTMGIQQQKKKIKGSINTSCRLRKQFKSCEKTKEPEDNESKILMEQKDPYRGLRPTFDYTANLRRKEQNRIKYKAFSAKKQFECHPYSKSYLLNDINIRKRKLNPQINQSSIKQESTQQKLPNQKNFSFIEIKKNAFLNYQRKQFEENYKVPRKAFYVGMRKIMSQKN